MRSGVPGYAALVPANGSKRANCSRLLQWLRQFAPRFFARRQMPVYASVVQQRLHRFIRVLKPLLITQLITHEQINPSVSVPPFSPFKR